MPQSLLNLLAGIPCNISTLFGKLGTLTEALRLGLLMQLCRSNLGQGIERQFEECLLRQTPLCR